jgi:hypothetical protein
MTRASILNSLLYLEPSRQSGAHHEKLIANLFKQRRHTQRDAALQQRALPLLNPLAESSLSHILIINTRM